MEVNAIQGRAADAVRSGWPNEERREAAVVVEGGISRDEE